MYKIYIYDKCKNKKHTEIVFHKVNKLINLRIKYKFFTLRIVIDKEKR